MFDGVAVIPLVAQQGCALGNGFDQRLRLAGIVNLRLAGIVNLPACQSQADRRPSASTRAWSSLVRPPRERPMPRS